MHLRTVGLACALAVLPGVVPGTSEAQRMNPPTVYDPNIYSRTRQTMTNRAVMRAALEKARARASAAGTGAVGTGTAGTGVASTGAAGTTTFAPVATSIAPRHTALAWGRTPDEQRRLERQFSEFLDSYRTRLREAGFAANDVSRAAAYVVTSSYYAMHDGRESLTDTQLVALRRHMSQAFAGNETFQKMSDRERQKLFEDYGISGTWIDAGTNTAKQAGDRRAMSQWRAMARQNFINILGAPPERVTITSRGVEFR